MSNTICNLSTVSVADENTDGDEEVLEEKPVL